MPNSFEGNAGNVERRNGKRSGSDRVNRNDTTLGEENSLVRRIRRTPGASNSTVCLGNLCTQCFSYRRN